MPSQVTMIPVTVEFCGGLDTIFNGEKEKKLQVEAVPRTKGDDGDSDDDSDGNGGGDAGVSTPPTPTTTVARVAAAAAALADPTQSHMLFAKGGGSEAAGGAVRPGVLVLVNDADWELCGGARARVSAGDRVTFISTLHGG